jgi:hypothetical protein
MAKSYGGKQNYFRPTIIKQQKDYLGPYPRTLQVGDTQFMGFSSGDSGPFWLSEAKREELRLDKVLDSVQNLRIGRYLLATKDKGLIMNSDKSGMECWVDSAHASEWSNKTASNDLSTARSRMGFIIRYAGCPMHWASKMQTEIALSTTEAEYIALSQAMREVLPIIWLVQEAHDHGICVLTKPPKIHCEVFEDNDGAIEIAKVPKMRPRTKHLNIKYYHFREEVKKGTISIYHVGTKEQIADIFTKPLEEGLFRSLREKLMGW